MIPESANCLEPPKLDSHIGSSLLVFPTILRFFYVKKLVLPVSSKNDFNNEQQVDEKIKEMLGTSFKKMELVSVECYPENDIKMLYHHFRVACNRKIELNNDFLLIYITIFLSRLPSIRNDSLMFKLKMSSNVFFKIIKRWLKANAAQREPGWSSRSKETGDNFIQLVFKTFDILTNTFRALVQFSAVSAQTPDKFLNFKSNEIAKLVMKEESLKNEEFIVSSNSPNPFMLLAFCFLRTGNLLCLATFLDDFGDGAAFQKVYVENSLKFLLEDIAKYISYSIGGELGESIEIFLEILEEFSGFITRAFLKPSFYRNFNIEFFLKEFFPKIIRAIQLIQDSKPKMSPWILRCSIAIARSFVNLVQATKAEELRAKETQQVPFISFRTPIAFLMNSMIGMLVPLIDEEQIDNFLLEEGIDVLERLLFSYYIEPSVKGNKTFYSFQRTLIREENKLDVDGIKSKYLLIFLGLLYHRNKMSSFNLKKLERLWSKEESKYFSFFLGLNKDKGSFLEDILKEKTVLAQTGEDFIKIHFAFRCQIDRIVHSFFPPFREAELVSQKQKAKEIELEKDVTYEEIVKVLIENCGTPGQLQEDGNQIKNIYNFFLVTSCYVNTLKASEELLKKLEEVLEAICTSFECISYCVFSTFGTLFPSFIRNERFYLSLVWRLIWKGIERVVVDSEKLEAFLFSKEKRRLPFQSSQVLSAKNPQTTMSYSSEAFDSKLIEPHVERAVAAIELCHYLAKYTGQLFKKDKSKSRGFYIQRIFCPECFCPLKLFNNQLINPYVLCHCCGKSFSNFPLGDNEGIDAISVESWDALRKIVVDLKNKMTRKGEGTGFKTAESFNEHLKLGTQRDLAVYVQREILQVLSYIE